MASFSKIDTGKLYRVAKSYKFVKVPSTSFDDMKDWKFELIDIARDEILLAVKAEISSSRRNPYLKAFLLWGEQLVYAGDVVSEMNEILQLVESDEC